MADNLTQTSDEAAEYLIDRKGEEGGGSRVSYRILCWGGRSLWGTATASCMKFDYKKFQVFWGGGGGGELRLGGTIPGSALRMKPVCH